jgi:hypothetical protein
MAEGKSEKDNQDKISHVMALVRLGYNDSKIGREIGIHRTTVKRYRDQGEKRVIGTEARIRVIQESLSRHFDSLCRICRQLQDATIITTYDTLENIIIEDLQPSQAQTEVLPARRGSDTKLMLKVDGGKAKVDHLSIEEELLFASLNQHTKNLDLWKTFQEWKDKTGEYISNLSGFYNLLGQRAIQESGLAITDSDDERGLKSGFARSVFINACYPALFGYRGFEGADYAVISPRKEWYGLRFDGYDIGVANDKKVLEKCQVIHSKMLDYYRDSSNHPLELQTSVKIRLGLQNLESEIFLELQKLILKRSFLGRCDLCPD